MKKIILISVCVVLIFINGCKKNEEPVSPENGDTGIVTGQVLSKNGVEKIQGALVIVANITNQIQTYTDIEGKYTLTGVPFGNQIIVITKGMFQSTLTVNVTSSAPITAPQTNLEAAGKLGFVSGSYDNIQHIIRHNLGYTIDSLTSVDLNDPAKLANYRAIFLNCGLDESPIYSGVGLDVLKTFIQNGGSVYASDWAGEFIEFMFPDKLTIETTGYSQIITASIIDQNLKSFIGKESVEINFDLGGWGEITQVGQSLTTLISADYQDSDGNTLTNKPLAVNFTYGSGTVLYTTFHNEVNVTTDAVKVLIGFLYSL